MTSRLETGNSLTFFYGVTVVGYYSNIIPKNADRYKEPFFLHAVVGKGAMNKITNPVTNGAMNLNSECSCRKWRNERSALLEPAPEGISYLTPAIPLAGRFMLRNTPHFTISTAQSLLCSMLANGFEKGGQAF